MDNERNLNSREIEETTNQKYRLMNGCPAKISTYNRNGLETVNGKGHDLLTRVKNPCSNDLCRLEDGPQAGYSYPNDGRMKDGARGIDTVLDRPATVGFFGDYMTDTVTRDYSGSYKGIYQNYNEMNNAQITYYVDQSTAQPFFSPVYTLSSYVDKVVFVDPMDSVKPQYYKTPVTSTLNSVCSDQFCRDQLSHRENLMASQSSLYNRTSWVNRRVTPTENC
jgi:hypothetical protein